MKGSLKIGVIAGIGIYLHWTFAILIAWIFTGSLVQGGSVTEATFGVAFVLALFGCVLLHELGHALTAKHYGIKTRDITLLPIGGLARLERIPEKPMQEFWVALAGPLVNVVIALAIGAWLAGRYGMDTIFNPRFAAGSIAVQLLSVNVILVLFNLLPAFPMDGGRILRALLATRLGRPRATRIAAQVGKMMAIMFAIVGLFYNPFLIFIALFVYFGASAEAQMVETTSMIQGLRVRDAMMTHYRTLHPSDGLDAAGSALLAGSQEDFPVVEDGRVLGILRRQDIARALAENPSQTVGQVTLEPCRPVDVDAALERTLELMRQENCGALPVLENGRMAGLLTLTNISELVMLRSAARGTPQRSDLAR